MKIKLLTVSFFIMLANTAISCDKGNKPEMKQQAITAEESSTSEKPAPIITANFPKEVSILLPTQYRKKSTGYPQNVKDKNWFELYKEEKTGKWLIGKADLKISYGRDECVGEDVMIIKSKHEDVVLFFTGFDGLNLNPETILEDKPLFPEHNISFKFKGQEYLLSPMGSVVDDEGHILPANLVREQTQQELADSQITDYTLSFSVGNETFNLATINKIEFSTPKIIWLGDLNGDDLPDMILDLSSFYETQRLFFFLSDPNDKKQPLKKVADLEVINDC
ncbi:hypothetical protein Q73A0000_02050 [Kaistella flava (ex Peng et al. 2021)]|uniref:VCBS repeat-containing protein n=1 Tax=Kaistella flava (ex Peng et al. 2021) TaxID=2038776 RepID=A0A7M2Y781_9FLAO|nr:hypothetical protein [Kaistella flava (ex Peng et al. 2021)]QOW09223.1 hypothetical protein Q73A0000_02050 [Kaistella flava (ex Peng et al. 2021)]